MILFKFYKGKTHKVEVPFPSRESEKSVPHRTVPYFFTLTREPERAMFAKK